MWLHGPPTTFAVEVVPDKPFITISFWFEGKTHQGTKSGRTPKREPIHGKPERSIGLFWSVSSRSGLWLSKPRLRIAQHCQQNQFAVLEMQDGLVLGSKVVLKAMGNKQHGPFQPKPMEHQLIAPLA